MFKRCFSLFGVSHLCLISVMVSLISCGGDEPCEYYGNCPAEPDENANDQAEVGDGVPGAIDYLDCSSLDPDKVYLHGTLADGSSGFDVIADPLEPTRFCMGFPRNVVKGIVSSHGNYIYRHELTFYSMVQEPFSQELTEDSPRQWPSDSMANDTELYTSTLPSCDAKLLALNPDSSEIFYSCPHATIHKQGVSEYYLLGANEKLLAVTSDGSMLTGVDGFTNELRLVDADLNETVIAVPSLGPEVMGYLDGKLHVDPVTSNESVWLLVAYNVFEFYRWSLDLSTLNLTEEGEFAPLPEGIAGFTDVKLDGNGDAWQIAQDTTQPSPTDVIVYRPLRSADNMSQVIYTEADDHGESWSTAMDPFVRMDNSRLVTGP